MLFDRRPNTWFILGHIKVSSVCFREIYCLFVYPSVCLLCHFQSLTLCLSPPLPVSPWHLPSSPSPSPRPLSVLFDINIVWGWPDGVGFRCGAVASFCSLLPGYKQVIRGPWWPVTVAHMLIEKLSPPNPPRLPSPHPACSHCTLSSAGNGQ